MWRLVLVVGVGLSLSCTASSVFICADDSSCGSGGRCEPNGYCSFPSDGCASGFAYGEASAPQLAGQCVDGPEATGTDVGSGAGDPSTGPGSQSTATTHDSLDSSGGVDPDTSTSTSTTGPLPTTGEPTTDSGSDCPMAEELLIWAEDCQLTAPMQYEVAALLPMDPLYAFSEENGAGTLTASAELQCDGTVYAWGLVLDPVPGNYANGDPDSFYVSLDGGPEVLWEYGCAFEGLEQSWQWVPIDPLGACGGRPLGLPVAAGVHELVARNHEGATNGVTAGIAAVFLSTDPTADPNDVYPVS